MGRRPSRVLDWIDGKRASCASMFSQIVELGLRERVDAVAITGDLIDKDNRFHEAYGPVERGLCQLAEGGIDVFAVAGNHDHDVLPRLVNAVGPERFHLLGQGGVWQSAYLMRDGAEVLRFVGWSFPAEHHPHCPLDEISTNHASSNGCPTVGLLHGDLDQPHSRYAPIALRDLQSTKVSAWLLGHIHRPRDYPSDYGPRVLYTGSPQAMDPGETGAHGAWLLDIDRLGRTTVRMAPLSLVRYDVVDIDLTGVETKEAFDAHVPRRLKQHLEHHCSACGPLEVVSVRLRLVGATSLHRRLREFTSEVLEQTRIDVHGAIARVQEIEVNTRPPVDLAQLARGSSVAAELARLMITLADETAVGDRAVDTLLDRTAQDFDEMSGARAFAPLSSSEYPPPSRHYGRTALLRQGMLLLDALVEQKGGDDDGRELR